jgi:hypothetical protein
MAWTTAQEVIDAWIGDDAPDDLNKVDLWIGRAEREIRSQIPGIQARLDIPEPDLLENVIDVVTSMVHRVFRNPEGTRSLSTTTGPFSEQRTFGGDTPGELFLSDRERAKLEGEGATSGGAFMIDMLPSTSPFSSNYVPVWPWA